MYVCLYVCMDATYAYALDMDCAVLIQAGFRRVLYIFFWFLVLEIIYQLMWNIYLNFFFNFRIIIFLIYNLFIFFFGRCVEI